MIEISHKQAQHLIRQAVDRRLPDEQWSLLQGHLERCEACSSYRDRLAGVERSLNRVLRLRWSAARGPAAEIGKRLVEVRERRQKLRKAFGKAFRYALIGLAIFVAFALLRPNPAPTEQAAAPLQPTATPPVELTPTPLPLTFRGQVGFNAGNLDIYLLTVNTGQVEITNLTESPLPAFAPAWSPDGEWLAFLAAYPDMGDDLGLTVMTVAGSRLTRLPNPPGVRWSGMPEWSYDGRWIIIPGQRKPNGPTFLYQVPVDGGEPRSIGYTRGALILTRLSPSLPMAAFLKGPQAVVNEPEGDIAVIHLETGRTVSLAQLDRGRNLQLMLFDWSLGGRSLVYLAGGKEPGGSEDVTLVRLSPELQVSGPDETIIGSPTTIDRQEGKDSILSVSWVPNSLLVAGLYDRGGCMKVELVHAYNRQVPRRVFDGLCAAGPFGRYNWTPDGNWLVLVAYPEEEYRAYLSSLEAGDDEAKAPTPALYALRVAEDDNRQAGARFERLAELDVELEMEGWDLFWFSAVRVRQVGRPLGIDPVGVDPSQEEPAAEEQVQDEPADDSGLERLAELNGIPEWIYTSVVEESEGEAPNVRIYRSRPDGSERESLGDAGGVCLRPGPGGKVAYLETSEAAAQIFLMDADGSNRTALTQGGPGRAYGCPVWSPDGSTLAAYYYGAVSGLVLAPVDGSPPRHYRLSIFDRNQAEYPLNELPDPLWIPAAVEAADEPGEAAAPQADGGRSERILLVQRTNGQAARLVEVDASGAEGGALLEARTLAILTGWEDVLQLAFSPDGSMLAALTVNYNRTQTFSGQTIAQLRLMDADTFGLISVIPLTNVDARTIASSRLAWLPDGALGLVRSIGVIGARKTIFERFDPASPVLRAERVAAYEDLLYDFAVFAGDDGDGWLGYATEGGFYAQTFSDFLRGEPPIRLWWDEVVDIGR